MTVPNLAWAKTATAGEYLMTYDESGLTSEEDPGSRCGFDDELLDEIDAKLRRRNMKLIADDRGLLAASIKERTA